jgi:hypothetical protein
MRNGKWLRLLAYVTGSVNQELLLRNEYFAAENQILRAKLPSRLRLCDPERATLAEIGKRLGRKALRDVACVAKPDTILAWYRRLVAHKFDGSKHRQYLDAPPLTRTWKRSWSGWRGRISSRLLTVLPARSSNASSVSTDLPVMTIGFPSLSSARLVASTQKDSNSYRDAGLA